MISSIVVTGKYNIGMNASKKIKISDNLFSVEKDIPFIRYRLDTYDDSTIEYIKKMMQQFNVSTHLAEFKLDANILSAITLVNNNIQNIAKYVYIDVTEEEVQAKALAPEKLALLAQVSTLGIDRFMFKDKSTSLDTITVREFMKVLRASYNISESNIGVCSSPLSFGDLACLTAVKARELMSLYSTVADVALPSANHQCMNCCGCIRYVVVSEDIAAPADNKIGAHKKEKTDGDTTEKKEKRASVNNKNVQMVTPGMFM